MIIGSNLLFFENLPSTNTFTADLLRKNHLAEGTIIQTNFQTAGRGYLSNKWESEDGKNLLISIVLYPSVITAAHQFFISMAISLGICDFLLRFIPGCRIKWPNDIYVNNDKIAGILIESSLLGNSIEQTIAGIGLNINQDKFSKSVPNPISLRLLSGQEYDVSKCLKELATDLDKRYKSLISGDFKKITHEYISHLYKRNEWFQFKNKSGIFTGKILTVTQDGRLVVEKQDHTTDEYSFKEIEFIL